MNRHYELVLGDSGWDVYENGAVIERGLSMGEALDRFAELSALHNGHSFAQVAIEEDN